MGKKRRAELNLDADRTVYGSFVQAANSISQLYTQAVQQSKKSQNDGARQAVETILTHVLREYGNSQSIPTAQLLHYLQQELQNADRADFQFQAAMPLQMPSLDSSPGSGDESMCDEPRRSRHSFVSPSKRMAVGVPTLAEVRLQGGAEGAHHVVQPTGNAGLQQQNSGFGGAHGSYASGNFYYGGS